MPNKACVEKYGKAGQIDCFLAGKLAEFIHVPIFIIQSGYDTWALHNVLGLNCVADGQGVPLTQCSVKESEAILKYRKYSVEAMKNFTNKNPNAGSNILIQDYSRSLVFSMCSCLTTASTANSTWSPPRPNTPSCSLSRSGWLTPPTTPTP